MMLELLNINAHYGHSQVLYDISLDVKQGEFVTIIGANGAGKSTLMKVIMGLVPVSSGTLLFKGQEIGWQPGLSFIWLRLPLGWRASTFARVAAMMEALADALDDYTGTILPPVPATTSAVAAARAPSPAAAATTN